MSSMLVRHAHIDALLTAGLTCQPGPLRWHNSWGGHNTLTFDTADEVGTMLLTANAHGVHTQYGDVVPDQFTTYHYQKLRGPVHPVIVLKAIDFLEYQSCDANDWPNSEAATFCDALRRQMIGRLYGYNEAPWGISNRSIFLTC